MNTITIKQGGETIKMTRRQAVAYHRALINNCKRLRDNGNMVCGFAMGSRMHAQAMAEAAKVRNMIAAA